MGEYNYDEQGQFFPFFVTALLLLVLVPLTYKSAAPKGVDKNIRIDCTCEGCENKRKLIATRQKQAAYSPAVIRKYILLVIGWSIVGYMSYRIATTKVEHKIWDPYVVLGIPASSSLEIIKSHYKKLSRTFHPDKIKLVGNLTKEIVETKFVELTKAYKALTDDEIRRNYEEYGHPDGKQEYSIGIALPKWIVESTNGYYLLAFYGLLFGVLMPYFIGQWWYGSRNLTKEGIETETAARYFKAVKENSSENDVVDMLAASHEFEKYLTENDRASKIDTVTLEKKLAQANVPLAQYQPVKSSETTDLSRNLIHAHLNRINLPPDLEVEKEQIVSEAIRFQNGLMQIALAFNFFEPVRASMEMSQCLLQAIPVGGSPLLQLPGVDNTMTRELRVRKKNAVKNIQDLLRLDEKERRNALAKLDGKTYAQAISIAKQIPILVLSNVRFKVTGDKIITPGAIVQLVFTARLATEKDYIKGVKSDSTAETSSDDSDADEDNVDILIGRKKSHNDGDPVPIPLAHAPYFPLEHKPRWWAFLADPRGNKIIVHPSVITDIGTTSRKFRVQFQAPPKTASYFFQLHVKSNSYYGTDVIQEVVLNVQDASKLEEKIVEEVIPENSDEGSDAEEEDSDFDEDEDDESDDTDTSTDSDSDSG